MIAAFLHGYPPLWSMGGEMSTHRTLRHVPRSVVFTNTGQEYSLDGVRVLPMLEPTVDSIREAAELVEADLLFAHSTLSVDTVRAGRRYGTPVLLAVHAPHRFAGDIRRAWSAATVRLYNTEEARRGWADNRGWVLHPPVGKPPDEYTPGPRDAFTLTSSLTNKGAGKVLALAERWPDRRFIIVRSPAHATHGDPAFFEKAGALPNIEVWPRVHPDDMSRLWAETRVLLVPSKYETYGMSALEAAGYGIPSVHVDTPHVREGIGDAALLLKGHTVENLAAAVEVVETGYQTWSDAARARAEKVWVREQQELGRFADNVAELINSPRAARRRSRGVRG